MQMLGDDTSPQEFLSNAKKLLRACSKSSSEDVQKYQDDKNRLQAWRKKVNDNLSGLRDYWRFHDEVRSLEKDLRVIGADASNCETSMKEQEDLVSDLQRDEDALREILDAMKRMHEDANRIAGNKMKIGQKKVDLKIKTPNYERDLRTVEREIAALEQEKDSLTNKITQNNKELNKLNNRDTELNTRVRALSTHLFCEFCARCLPASSLTARRLVIYLTLRRLRRLRPELRILKRDSLPKMSRNSAERSFRTKKRKLATNTERFVHHVR